MRQMAMKLTRSKQKDNHVINMLDVGWGGRTRTSEWRNQKSPCHFDFFTHFFPTGAESAHDASNGYGQIPDCSPQGGAHKNSLR
jgi:hypothetical protein